MPHEVETMAYRHEGQASVPWHGLGNPIDHDATPEEMLVAAELNWTVSKRPLFTPATSSLSIEGFDAKDFKGYLDMGGTSLSVSDYFALVRDSDNKILGPAGKDYIPIQNAQAFNFFKKFTDAGHMRMETAGSLQDGKQVWVLAKLKKSFVLPGGDEVHGYLLLSSPHIWGKSFVIKFVTIRVVCMNTFTMAMNESSHGKGFRMPHIRAFDGETAQQAQISLGIASELFEGFESTANKLAKTVIDDDVVIRYVADVFQPEMMIEAFGKGYAKKSEADQAKLIVDPTSPRINPDQFKRTAYDVFKAIERQPGAEMESARGTLWGAFNATTYYADHLAGRDRDNAIYSAWFGPKAATKTSALKRAVQLAEVISTK
jgi:phage/plasmid-like protein (TIGR03299 family)